LPPPWLTAGIIKVFIGFLKKASPYAKRAGFGINHPPRDGLVTPLEGAIISHRALRVTGKWKRKLLCEFRGLDSS